MCAVALFDDGSCILNARKAAEFSWIITIAASLPGILLSLFVFWPGLMSTDSLNQYGQALSGQYHDWHPPLMAALWRRLLPIANGPAPMLCLQVIIFWVSLTAVSVRLIGKSGYISAQLIGLYPTSFALIGAVWKDVQMTASLLAVAALLGWFPARGWRRTAVTTAVILLLGYVVGLRHNALVAVVPFTYWLAESLYSEATVRRKIQFAAAFAVGLFIANSALTRLALKPEHRYITQALMQFDIAGTGLSAGVDFSPQMMIENTAESSSERLERMRRYYTPWSVDPLYYATPRFFQRVTTSEENSRWRREWVRIISSHPLDYLQHRASATAALLGLLGGVYSFHTQIDPNPYAIELAHPDAVERVAVLATMANAYGAFRAWPYLLLLLFEAVVYVRFRATPQLYIAASALFYFVPYPFISISTDFRYLWWLNITSLVLLVDAVMLMFRRRAVGSAPPASTTPTRDNAHRTTND